jgi:type IV pilus assembly protein PilQ
MKSVGRRKASRRRGPTVGMQVRGRGFAMVAAVLSLLIADGAARAQSRGVVESVSAAEGADGVTAVLIAVSARPTFTTWKLEQPARVVIDISGTRLGPVTVPFDAGTFAVGSISAIASDGDGGQRTRVVLTLRRPADYDVESSGNKIAVRVRPHEKPSAGRAEQPVKAEPAARAEATRLSEERKELELERQRIARAEQATAEAARKLAAERAEADKARAEADRAHKVAQQDAAAEAARLAKERSALESLRAELSGREKALASAESDVKRTQKQTEELRRRTEEARQKEEARSGAVREAAEKLAQQREQLDAKLAASEEQRRRLAAAEKLVGERETSVKQSAQDLERRELAVRSAAARLAGLAKQAGASQALKDEATAALAEAEAERKTAAAAAQRSRQDLEQAVAARRHEDERRTALERERLAEEQRLKSAATRRAQEETRLAQAAEARRREESRMADVSATRSRLEAERGRLEAERQNLVSELGRLRKSPPAPAPKPVATAVVPARQLVEDPPVRPFSITLRAPSRVQRIDFVDEPSRSSVIIELDEPSAFKLLHSGGQRVSLQLYKTELPRVLERSLDATEYLGPVKVISSYRDPAQRDAVRIDVEMAEAVPNTVRQDGARLYWDFRKSPSSARALEEDPFQENVRWPRKIAGFSSAPLAPMIESLLIAQATAPGASMRASPNSKKRYTGRRIDLDFKGADIHNILRLLADVGVVNIVTSDDVKGEVTIKMRDVPWDQALDVVLRQKQLGQVREGNLIRVAPLSVLEKELEQEIARQKQITEVLPTETRLIGVSYAAAKNLLDRAKDLLSPRGKISVDERTNTLIVSDVARNLSLIEELIRSLDTQTSQVIIEARIVEARSTFVRQIGVQWGGTGFADSLHGNPTGLVFPHNIGIGGGATDGNTPMEGLVPGPRSGTGAANPNFAVNLPAAVGTGAGGALGLTMGSVAGAFNLNLRLSAMESSGQVRILSSPRISTLDNNEASIEQGVSIPISVVSAQGVQTVFVDAKLNLTVKPHVTNDGTVMMDIKVTRNEPDFVNTGARGDPTILKKEAQTSMLVRDGDTAVIGGIYQRNSGLNYAKIPFLADIPVLGALFRNRRENDDRTEFLVFITPRIANRARALGN